MVKIRGRNSNGKTVKWTAKNGRKISGDDAARPAWVTGARRQQFAAASRFWSIPNLMPRSTVTRVWVTEWAHLGQLCGALTSDNLFFCRFVSVVWQDGNRGQSVTRYRVPRKKFDVILRFLVDRYRRTKPPKPDASQFIVPARLPKRRCARSQLHMNSVVLAESQRSCALVRTVWLQKFDRRDNMLFTVHLNRLIAENIPLQQSTIEPCLQ